jgi:electron transfer flavoprotein alpha subunit
MSDNKGVLVYCESNDGKLSSIATELLGAGSRLARESGQSLQAVILGSGLGTAANEAIAFGAEKVYVVDDPILKDYLTDSYLMVMEKVVKQIAPSILLLGQTPIGRDLTSRLAFRLNSAAVLDCVALAIDGATGRLLMTKPVYGGNAQAVQICDFDPQVATVRAKSMTPAIKDESRKGEIVNMSAGLDPALIRTRLIERKIESSGVKLEEAKVIVSGGRGIGGTEGFKQLEELARMLKGAVGASRPACDNKWVSDNLQIGLTGKIVSPDLYIAVALSGSSQHLSGCSGSKVIVAINKDAEANIFKVAHFGIVADWKKALPSFTARVKELMG